MPDEREEEGCRGFEYLEDNRMSFVANKRELNGPGLIRVGLRFLHFSFWIACSEVLAETEGTLRIDC